MSLQTPEGIRWLQKTLYVNAKSEPAYRFYLAKVNQALNPTAGLFGVILAVATGGVSLAINAATSARSTQARRSHRADGRLPSHSSTSPRWKSDTRASNRK